MLIFWLSVAVVFFSRQKAPKCLYPQKLKASLTQNSLFFLSSLFRTSLKLFKFLGSFLFHLLLCENSSRGFTLKQVFHSSSLMWRRRRSESTVVLLLKMCSRVYQKLLMMLQQSVLNTSGGYLPKLLSFKYKKKPLLFPCLAEVEAQQQKQGILCRNIHTWFISDCWKLTLSSNIFTQNENCGFCPSTHRLKGRTCLTAGINRMIIRTCFSVLRLWVRQMSLIVRTETQTAVNHFVQKP